MATLLLIVIYIAFLGRGMPDSITGSAWAMMFGDFNVPESYVSIITITISLSTALISLLCSRLIKRFGTFKIALVAISMLALTLLGYYFSTSFIFLCLLAVPLGGAAGLVDNALNDYMTAHYSAMYLNIMHGVYGIGAALSPFLFSVALSENGNWRNGYLLCFFVMLGIAAIVAVSAPLWKKNKGSEEQNGEIVDYPLGKQLKSKLVWTVLLCVFLANAIEALFVAFGGTYLVSAAKVSEAASARIITAFCLGMGGGRMFAGFLSIKISCKKMIAAFSCALMLPAAILLFALPEYMLYITFCLVGFLCGPVYPLVIYIGPELFGGDKSHAVLGTQIAVAYSGFVVSQLLMSLIVEKLTISVFPILCFIFAILLVVFTLYLWISAAKSKINNAEG